MFLFIGMLLCMESFGFDEMSVIWLCVVLCYLVADTFPGFMHSLPIKSLRFPAVMYARYV